MGKKESRYVAKSMRKQVRISTYKLNCEGKRQNLQVRCFFFWELHVYISEEIVRGKKNCKKKFEKVRKTCTFTKSHYLLLVYNNYPTFSVSLAVH